MTKVLNMFSGMAALNHPRVVPFSGGCFGRKKYPKKGKQKQMEQLALRTGDCKIAMLWWSSGFLFFCLHHLF